MGIVSGYCGGVGQRVFVILRTGEDSGERVVIFRAYGVVLMVVAAGASDGEAEEATADHVHAIMAFVGAGLRWLRDTEVPRAQPEEAQTTAQPFVIGQQVAGDLRFDEGVIGQVLVQGVDYPVAVAPGVGIGFGRGAGEVVFPEAGDIEPVAGPAFAKVGRGQQLVDEGFGRSLTGDKGLDFDGGWGQSGEVVGETANEGSAVGGRAGHESLGAQALFHQSVDGGCGECGERLQ